ncbi:hypothetical protein Riv7116_6270 [Rivularia sp. PCC 7116]|uniref:hypothetical protein n=1 Tax=Rivularia sp. PCC 7116 TaxID=373994 RepID=UPI00029F2E8B|nr:hypothetical protein [Rivularia sp. PCC 7116]AFY58619.1 hypothetical protein Riv7116_6270 [Rivularia sp. PCC 7116]
MLVSEILRFLPDSLEWMVLFDLPAIQKLTNLSTIKAMYHLPEDIDLEPHSHIVLTSAGRFLAFQNQLKLVEAISQEELSVELTSSLANRFQNRLKLVPVDESHCLGLGEQPPFSPVILHLRLENDLGRATAIFEREPSFEHYELLRAVGVKFTGGELKDDYYLARFQNRLPVHIHAGILSHFSRTAHCNIFFFQHGNIDNALEDGLLKASQVRINWTKQQCLQSLTQLATISCEKTLSMTCQPPAPQKPFAYGDLVPLGFVLKALNEVDTKENSELDTAKQKLQQFLLNQQQDQLWAFHTQRLITATDSSLVLLGLDKPESVEALERFSDGEGGYYPQLWSKYQEPGKMLLDESCSHWCQPDYATTCLVRWLRNSAGLETKTDLEYLADGFSQRAGLYFANPYLVDWMLAEAIREDKNAATLRERLLVEIIASMNEDFSFGKYDVALSTALGILTLAALGVSDRTICAAQLRLLELIGEKSSISIPFYSTLCHDSELNSQEKLALQLNETFTRSKDGQKQIRSINGQLHSISLYLDTHEMITTAICALALDRNSDLNKWQVNRNSSNSNYSNSCHPRYQCKTHSQYIAKFALPPYLKKCAVSL